MTLYLPRQMQVRKLSLADLQLHGQRRRKEEIAGQEGARLRQPSVRDLQLAQQQKRQTPAKHRPQPPSRHLRPQDLRR